MPRSPRRPERERGPALDPPEERRLGELVERELAALATPVIDSLAVWGVIGEADGDDEERDGDAGDELFLERPDPKYTSCVKDTEYMRYHHWELLRGIREEIVRYGIRGEVNLARCRDCHTSRETFCNRCHDAVSLTPDCFGCHYYP